jgi:soluble lytic murein transglycosylase-like protein
MNPLPLTRRLWRLRSACMRLPRMRLPCAAAALAAVLVSPTATARAAPEAGAAFDPRRLMELGRFFETADARSQDLQRSHDLYCRAAAAAHPEALSRLGWMYAKGTGVERDEAVSATMFRWAAAMGDAAAAGLAGAMKGPAESPPPCLVERGAGSLAALRARRASASMAGDGSVRPAATDSVSAAERSPQLEDAAGAADADGTPLVESPVQFRTDPPPAEHVRLVRLVVREAARFRLDPRLVLAVMQTESSFDARARSSKNAQGLMQLIPDTARRFKVQDVNDPVQNMRGGMAYLRWLLDYFHGDVALALAGYNAGEGAVDRHRGVPPYRETIAYVQRIRALYPFDRHPFDEASRAASGNRSWVLEGLASSGLEALSHAQ